jgi:hypothetical protein
MAHLARNARAHGGAGVTREQLEHLIRAAADIAADDEIVVIGSQSVLGQFPDAPAAMRVSVEADMFPLNHPDRADLIDGTIGELSPFHRAYGYYAQGVDAQTAKLAPGWEKRLVTIENDNTRGAKGLCLEIHDLLVSKAVAGRDKDHAFLRHAARSSMADETTLLERLASLDVDEEIREKATAAIRRAFGAP